MLKASFSALLLIVVLTGCHRAGGSSSSLELDRRIAAADLVNVHDAVKVAGLEDRRFDQRTFLEAIRPIVESGGLEIEVLGESAEGRTISMYSLGTGPVPVLLWSQMHGDESTATMALADIYAFLTTQPGHPVARAILGGATIHTIPMLNPDGAERFQRRNAQGVDVNRDARMLSTPEGRILKGAVDRIKPRFGFNLHDQNVRTRVEGSHRGVAIALLSPPFDESRGVNPVRERAMRVAGVIRTVIEPLVGGHIARYDDTFNPRAFGDLTTSWGVSTVLVEAGGWEGDPQKQFLRKVKFVGLLSALEAIATGSYAKVNTSRYSSLPENGRSIADLLITGGTLVAADLPPLRADLLVNYADPLIAAEGAIVDVGDLQGTAARDTLDANGLYLMLTEEALDRSDAGVQIRLGRPAAFSASRRLDGSDVIWTFEGAPAAERSSE